MDSRPPLPAPEASRAPLGLTALYCGEFFLLVANAIAFTAIAARAVAAGLDSRAVGAAGSAFYVGLFAVYLAGPALVTRFGLKPLALATAPIILAGLAALTVPEPAVWFAGRFVMGIGTALVYVAMENWINLRVRRDGLGRALAIYMAVYLGSYAAGQAVLLAVPSTSDLALAIAAASLAVGLACFATAAAPAASPAPPRRRGGARLVLRTAFLGIAASLASGLAAGAFYALGPVYALQIGLGPEQAPVFLIAVIVGASIAQVLLGRAGDRLGRIRVLGLLSVTAGATSLALLPYDAATPLVFALALIWGSSALTAYATAAALAYGAPHGRPAREVAQFVLVANGVGGILGPSLASVLDGLAPGKGLFVLAAAVYAALGLMLAVARRKTARPG
jgi:MFS family permease